MQDGTVGKANDTESKASSGNFFYLWIDIDHVSFFNLLKLNDMLYRVIFLFVLGMFFYGCADDNLLSDEEITMEITEESPHLNGVAVTKPFNVRSQGTSILVPNPEQCGEFLYLVATGEGHATLIGKFDVEITTCFNPFTLQTESPIYGIHTMASGDMLYGVSATAEQIPGTSTYIHNYEYYQGTDRFEGVTGSLKLYVDFDLVTGDWTAEGEGELTY